MYFTLKVRSRPPVTISPRMLWHTVSSTVKLTKKTTKQIISIRPHELRTWMVGHASVLINFFGTTILTDPVFVKWLPVPKRRVAAGLLPRHLPTIDYCIISHAHIDHFNRRSLRQISHKIRTVIVPKNCTDLLPSRFRHTIELGWNKTSVLQDLSITAFRPVHWGERYFWEHKGRGYNSYIVRKNGRSIFFCGDSAYGKFFKQIGYDHQPDIAFLPIGTYDPDSLKKIHMGPLDALRAFRDLKAKHFIPIHWGNFRLSAEHPYEPPRLLEALAERRGFSDRVHVLENGQSVAIPL